MRRMPAQPQYISGMPQAPPQPGMMGPVQPGTQGLLPKEFSNYYDLFVEVFNKNDSQILRNDPQEAQGNDEKLR